jgi:uncharacterized protein (DUF2164 family)
MKKVNMDQTRITLSEDRKEDIISRLTGLFDAEFDEELSRFRAERLLEFFISLLGPSVYNQAIQDARQFFSEKLEDLEATLYEKESESVP